MMNENGRTIMTLALIGAVAAMGKALASAEEVTWRMLVGRTLIGSVLSMSAASVLLHIPDAAPLAVVGVGAALGVAGEQCIEIYLRRVIKKGGGGSS
ncbi:MAG: holin [Plesiomonas shigelloides]